MTIGRPLQFDPERVLEQAMQAFWSKGYEATSLQELLDAMGLSKSSLYQAFGSKRQLFEKCVNRYLDMLAASMLAELSRAQSARRFIEEMFLALAGGAGSPEAKRGCLFWNTAIEFGQRDPRVTKLVRNAIGRFSDVFARAVERAQQQGEIPRDKNPQVLGSYLFSSMSGLRAMLKGGVDARCAREIARTVLQALD